MSPSVLIALVLLLPAVWGLSAVVSTITRPRAFAESSSGTGSGFFGPGKPGERYTFTLFYGPLPDVTMTSARLILSHGSVASATTVSICQFNPHQGDDIVGIGAATGDLSDYCSAVIPVGGKELGRLGPKDSLIATVVPLTKGRVRVTGADLIYDQRGRHASERIDVSFTIGVRP